MSRLEGAFHVTATTVAAGTTAQAIANDSASWRAARGLGRRLSTGAAKGEQGPPRAAPAPRLGQGRNGEGLRFCRLGGLGGGRANEKPERYQGDGHVLLDG